jgi:hypothetical protein
MAATRLSFTLKGFGTAEITGSPLRTSEKVRADAKLKTVGVNNDSPMMMRFHC